MLRDYGVKGQLGLEATAEEYLKHMVGLFEEVRRVLRGDGTLWLNLGDGFKDKNLVGVPWRLALALQAEGWYLRSDIIWHKPNAMPESTADRPSKAHEYIFLLSKSQKYYYDNDAIRIPHKYPDDVARRRRQDAADGVKPFQKGQFDEDGKVTWRRPVGVKKMNIRVRDAQAGRLKEKWGDMQNATDEEVEGYKEEWQPNPLGRTRPTVWTVPTKRYADAHFATYPLDLIIPCILAGCPPEGVVLDPFLGSGTTIEGARKNGRVGLGFELNPEYAKMIEKRGLANVPALDTFGVSE